MSSTKGVIELLISENWPESQIVLLPKHVFLQFSDKLIMQEVKAYEDVLTNPCFNSNNTDLWSNTEQDYWTYMYVFRW